MTAADIQTNVVRPNFNNEVQGQQARGEGVSRGHTPTLTPGDFPDIAERPDPTRIVYKPGEASRQSREFQAAYMETLLQAACIDLGIDPVDLDAAPDSPRSGWLIAEGVDDASGATVSRRIALVQGLSAHWLKIGLRQLLYSGWQRPLPELGAGPDPAPN